MKTLIIEEKPSLGKTVAAALGVKKIEKGYMESENIVISWVIGHIFSLKNIDEYEESKNYPKNEKGKLIWDKIPLPFVPKFSFKISKEKKEQFEILQKLMKREDINEIVHCGDAGREGQIIIDLLLMYVKNKKNVTRLWLPDQTDESIRRAYKNRENNNTSKYVKLHNEGLGRLYIDWLLGVNTTILATNKSGELLKIGRVKVPVVEKIYSRDMEIKNFVPEKYYIIESDLNNIKLQCKDKFLKDDYEKAKEIATKLNQFEAEVIDIIEKEIKKQPKKLFSMTSLQKEVNNKYKMPLKEITDILQKLYEEKYITYPRTNTEYLAEEERNKVKEIIENFNDENLEFNSNSKLFNNKYIEDHSAIIPTTKIPISLEEKEKIIYDTIRKRFFSNFTKEECIVSETTLEIKVGTELFKLKGAVIKQLGFMKYEPQKIVDNLPNLRKNEEFKVCFEVIDKMTTPPNKMTISTLLSYLENPFVEELKSDKSILEEYNSDDEKYKNILKGCEIGTGATREPIITECINMNYISLDGTILSIEEKGITYIEILKKMKIDMFRDKSVKVSENLKKIYKDELTIKDVINIEVENLKEMIESAKTIEAVKKYKTVVDNNLDEIGIYNNQEIYKIETKNGIMYASKNKDFIIFENSKIMGCDVKITETKVKSLIQNKKTIFNLTNKKGKKYKGFVVLDGVNEKGYAKFKLDGFVK